MAGASLPPCLSWPGVDLTQRMLSDNVSIAIDRADDPVVARVDGSPIYRLDVRRAAEASGQIGADEALEPTDPVFRASLEELIDQRLLALDALRSGVASDEEARRRLAAAQDRILGNYRVEHYLAETVTDEAVRELYEAQRELAGTGEERELRRIVRRPKPRSKWRIVWPMKRISRI